MGRRGGALDGEAAQEVGVGELRERDGRVRRARALRWQVHHAGLECLQRAAARAVAPPSPHRPLWGSPPPAVLSHAAPDGCERGRTGARGGVRRSDGERACRAGGARLLDLRKRVVAVLVQVADLLGVDLDHAQQQLPRQPQRQRRLWVDDGVCTRRATVKTRQKLDERCAGPTARGGRARGWRGERCDARAPTDESMFASNTWLRFRRLSSVAAIHMMPSGPFLARICTE